MAYVILFAKCAAVFLVVLFIAFIAFFLRLLFHKDADFLIDPDCPDDLFDFEKMRAAREATRAMCKFDEQLIRRAFLEDLVWPFWSTADSVWLRAEMLFHLKHKGAEYDRDLMDYIVGIYLDTVFDTCEQIWNPTCGSGYLSQVFERAGFQVRSTDFGDYGFGISGIDFLACDDFWPGDIVAAPLYGQAEVFVRKGLDLVSDGRYVALLLKSTFSRGWRHRELCDRSEMSTVIMLPFGLRRLRDGSFERCELDAAHVYSWFVWQKGHTGVHWEHCGFSGQEQFTLRPPKITKYAGESR